MITTMAQTIRAATLMLAITAAVFGTSSPALSHGDGAPQPVDTTGLKPLGEDILPTNPYRGDPAAIKIGGRGYNSNCARCHGLDVKSGGMAPDLRALEPTDDNDGWFMTRVLMGATINDRVKMPPFKGLLSQEAIWAIRSYVDSQPDDK